jgi:hypothetical protein
MQESQFDELCGLRKLLFHEQDVHTIIPLLHSAFFVISLQFLPVKSLPYCFLTLQNRLYLINYTTDCNKHVTKFKVYPKSEPQGTNNLIPNPIP